MRIRVLNSPATVALLAVICSFLPVALAAQRDRPVAGDEAAIRQLISTFSASVSTPARSTKDWSAFRALFVPGARIEAVVRDSAGALAHVSQTVDEYITAMGPAMLREGFREQEMAAQVVVYGDIAHAWNGYAVTRGPAGTPRRVRGINSFQCVRQDGQWRIAHLLWTNERAAGPVPRAWAAPETR